MKNILRITAGSFLILMASAGVQAQMTLTGELIPRTEFRHGYQAPLDSAIQGALATQQRTRLNFGYTGEKFKVGVSLQDVRTWGSTSQLNTTDGFTSLHEGWGQYFFTSKFSLKAGRQEVVYDDERIFGGVNWTMQGRSHDLFLFSFEDTASKFKANLGIAYNQNVMGNIPAPYTVATSYKEMHYLWLNKKFGNLSASILVLNTGVEIPLQVNRTYLMNTVGTHLEYKKDKFFGSGRFYYQMGETMVGTSRKDVAAMMFGADLKYTLAKKFTVGLGLEYMTGQSQTDTTKAYRDVTHVFNTLYGTGHKFNGYMDYFYAGSGHGNVGLMDLYLNLKYKAEKSWVGLDVHMFSASADVLNVKDTAGISAMNASLGTEIDLTFNKALTKQVSLQMGYSHYLTSETLAWLKGITDYKGDGYTDATSNWAYVMFIFKPNFLK